MKADILFAIWPYVALGASGSGLFVRYLFARRHIDEARAEVPEAKAIFAGGRVWRVSLCLLLTIHVLVLLAPRAILAWNGVPLRLYALEGSGFLFGALAVGGWAEAMWRHLSRPSASIKSAVGDAVLLGLLFVVLASGFFMQALYRWGSSWGAVTLTPYFVSLLRGKPVTDLVDQMPFLVRLHVASSFGVLVALPFSRVASFLIVALHGTVASIAAPAGRAARGVEARLKARAAAWIWEEDTDPDFAAPEWRPLTQSGIVTSPAGRSERTAGDRDKLHATVTKAQ
jgi:nitrate reductase gamma subunit